MMKSKRIPILACLAVLFVAVCVQASTVQGADEPVRVLFVGNSLTSVNNLPAMVAEVARS